MKKHLYKKFCLYFVLYLAGMIGLYTILFSLQFGPYVSTEYWIKDAYSIKCHIAKNITTKKIVIVSGSGGLYSFDSPLFERITGHKMVNMSVHAGLSLDFILVRRRLFLKKGDIVILPLEYSYYRQEIPFNDRTLEAIIAWDREFFDNLSLRKRFQLIRSCSPLRMVAVLIQKFVKRQKLHTISVEKAVSQAIDTWVKQNPGESRYITSNLNFCGDILYNRGSNKFIPPDGYSGLSNPSWQISSYFIGALTSFVKYCRNEGIQLFFTWPATMKSKNFLLTNPYVQRNISQVRNFFDTLGIPVLGDQKDYYFEKDHFFNTAYHLNSAGRVVRTLRFANQLLNHKDFR